ncbi:hypothetical protein NMB32_08880 [Stenotrophomonas sp. CD2]|nr:hypothetical protein NMB32_08880 [Stenotrophomonas sp. CD2]
MQVSRQTSALLLRPGIMSSGRPLPTTSTCTLPAAGALALAACAEPEPSTAIAMPIIASRARAFIAYQSARKIFIVCSFVGWVLPGWEQRAAGHGTRVAISEQRPIAGANGRRRRTVRTRTN